MKKKKIILAALTALTALSLTACGEPKQTTKEMTVEAGSDINLDAKDYFDSTEEKLDKVIFDTSKVDTSIPGDYEVTATYDKKTYTIKVTVADTKVPQVTIDTRYVITNDVAKIDVDSIITKVKDKTECTAEITGYEKKDIPVSELDEAGIKAITDTIVIPGKQDELAKFDEAVPTEEGLYRAAVCTTDLGDNKTYEEILVIVDTTAPQFGNLEDVTVEQDDVTAEPEINTSNVSVGDNLDGAISIDDCEVTKELTDEANHQWTVTVKATDRAGNETSATYFMNVTKKTTGGGNTTSSNTGSTNPNKKYENNNTDEVVTGGAGGTDAKSADNAFVESQGFMQVVVVNGYYAVFYHDEASEGDAACQLLIDFAASQGYVLLNTAGGHYGQSDYMYQMMTLADYCTPLS